MFFNIFSHLFKFEEFENSVKNKDENVTFIKQAYMPEMIEILRKKL